MSRVLVALVIGLGSVGVPAQVFRSSSELVRVDVLVTDGRRPIGALTRADFELRDSGVTQTIADLQTLDVPFSLLLALDTSSSMQGQPLEDLRDGARAAVEALQPEDRAAILTFTHVVGGATRWTAERSALLRDIDALRAEGSTSLFDAALAAVVQRDPEPGRRNLLIVFSDGRDTASWLPDFAALDLVRRTDIVVYGVTTGMIPMTPSAALERRSGIRLARNYPINRADDFLEGLTERTGGQRLSSRSADLRRTFQRIVTDFRSRYVLTYTPTGVSPSGWHPIEVKLVKASGKVTARRGYERSSPATLSR